MKREPLCVDSNCDRFMCIGGTSGEILRRCFNRVIGKSVTGGVDFSAMILFDMGWRVVRVTNYLKRRKFAPPFFGFFVIEIRVYD